MFECISSNIKLHLVRLQYVCRGCLVAAILGVNIYQQWWLPKEASIAVCNVIGDITSGDYFFIQRRMEILYKKLTSFPSTVLLSWPICFQYMHSKVRLWF